MGTARPGEDNPASRQGTAAGGRNQFPMRLAGVDLSAALQRHSVRGARTLPHCASCRRRPLPGELLHVYDAGKTLCTLCVGALPVETRAPLRSERIHAAERQLAVVPRAA